MPRPFFQVITEKEKEIIRDLSKCGFKEIDAHFKLMSEQRKARSKEERKAEKVMQMSPITVTPKRPG